MKKIIIKNTIGQDGCLCGEYNDGKTRIKAHCWRTAWKGCNCSYAGIHYEGDIKTAKRIAREIEKDYICKVKIVKGI